MVSGEPWKGLNVWRSFQVGVRFWGRDGVKGRGLDLGMMSVDKEFTRTNHGRI